jgi:hypothetical protein
MLLNRTSARAVSILSLGVLAWFMAWVKTESNGENPPKRLETGLLEPFDKSEFKALESSGFKPLSI